MDLNLQNRVAIVTGGNKGLGQASAWLLAKEGARLFLTARNNVQLTTTAARLRQAFGTAIETVSVDLTTSGGADEIAKTALDTFGRIDILVNCAGDSQGGLFWEIPDQVWQDSLALKFIGTVRMIRAVIPTMRAQKYGRIVTVAGNTGKQPMSNMLPGAAANAALLAVNTGLAQVVASEGIVLNIVNPGPSRTERWNTLMQKLASDADKTVNEIEAGFISDIPMKRLGEPGEIAGLIVFLCSDVAANMTGTSITADGGWSRTTV